jgi:uncharacterized OB-fold protein
MNEYRKPLPVPSPESRPLWEGCRKHELLIQRCDTCRQFVFPPNSLCPACLGTGLTWTKTTGCGRVYSFVVYHRVYHPGFENEIPYVVAIVELEEGARLLSNIIGCPPDQVRCEMPVEVAFEEVTEAVTLFKFQPRQGGPVQAQRRSSG